MSLSSTKLGSSTKFEGTTGKVYSSESSPGCESKDVFFNSQVPISHLRKKTEEVDIEELFEAWDKTHKQFTAWASHASSPLLSAQSGKRVTKFPDLLTPPPGFERVRPMFRSSEISTESEISPSMDMRLKCKVTTNDVTLSPAPCKSGLVKREKRGQFNEENVSDERFSGEIKFYQLKKRFGFISLDLDKTDVFLCEDDLVLSGVSIKKFKEAIFKRVTVKLSFFIKVYDENSVKKRKAVDVKVETELI
jgi:hypothetical protein